MREGPKIEDAVHHHKEGRLAEAEQLYLQILAQIPEQPDALYFLGIIAAQAGRNDDAYTLMRRSLRARPSALVASDFGQLLNRMRRYDDALACCNEALRLDPSFVPAHLLKGQILQMFGIFDEGLASLRQAAALRPGDLEIENSIGLGFIATGHADEAVPVFQKLIARSPDDFMLHANLTFALLILGRFDEGFQEYQWRWDRPEFKAAYPGLLWRGEDMAGSTLLIHGEHGFGDAIQFCRYVPLAAKRGIKVVLRMPRPLVRLMRSLEGIEGVITSGEPLPSFTRHCSVMDLPAAFHTRPETIPAHIPYLKANEEDAARWRARMPAKKGVLKVGLCWSGAPNAHSAELNAKHQRRSIPIQLFAPLYKIPGIEFYSLQKDAPSQDILLLRGAPLIDFMGECQDFADTAALITQLDLVISVDTSIVHLAGALGKPVWLLNRYDTCWRWFYKREDSPWYPTMRLFRQSRSRDWTEVIERVGRTLAKKQD